MSRRTDRSSAVLAVTCLAAFLVLGGAGGAAVSQAPPSNSVGTAQLKNNAVTTPKIKNAAVVAAKIANNAVVAAKIASNAVASAKIAATPSRPRRSKNAVTTAKVQDGSLTAGDVAVGVLPPGSAAAASPRAAERRCSSDDDHEPRDRRGGRLRAAGEGVRDRLSAGSARSAVACRRGPTSTRARPRRRRQPATLSLIVLNTYNAAGTADSLLRRPRETGELREDHRPSRREPQHTS